MDHVSFLSGEEKKVIVEGSIEDFKRLMGRKTDFSLISEFLKNKSRRKKHRKISFSLKRKREKREVRDWCPKVAFLLSSNNKEGMTNDDLVKLAGKDYSITSKVGKEIFRMNLSDPIVHRSHSFTSRSVNPNPVTLTRSYSCYLDLSS